MPSQTVVILREDELEVARALRRWFAHVLGQSCILWTYDKYGFTRGDDGQEKRFEDTLGIDLFIIFRELKFLSEGGKSLNLIRNIWKFQKQKGSPLSHAILFSCHSPLDLLRDDFIWNNIILSESIHVYQIPFELEDVERYLEIIEDKSFALPEKYLDPEIPIDSHDYKNYNAVVDFFFGAVESGETPEETIKDIKNKLLKELLPWDFRRREIEEMQESFKGERTSRPVTDKVVLIDDTDEWEVVLEPIFKLKGLELKRYKEWDDNKETLISEDSNAGLVLLDMMINGKELRGKEILQDIRGKLRPHIPVVLFSVSDAYILLDMFQKGEVDNVYVKGTVGSENKKEQYNNLLKFVEKNVKVSRIVEPFQQRIDNLSLPDGDKFRMLQFYLTNAALYLKKACGYGLDEKPKREQVGSNIKASMYFSGLAFEKLLEIIPYKKGFRKDTIGWEIFMKDNRKESYPFIQYHTIGHFLRNIVAHPSVSIDNFLITDALIFISIILKLTEHYVAIKPGKVPAIFLFLKDIGIETLYDNIIIHLQRYCCDKTGIAPGKDLKKIRKIIGNIIGIYDKNDKDREKEDVWDSLTSFSLNNPHDHLYIRYLPYLADELYLSNYKKHSDDENMKIAAMIFRRMSGDDDGSIIDIHWKEEADKGRDKV